MLSFIYKLSNTKRTLIIAGLLLAGIANLGITAARIHHSGTEVILATLPVDPRSLFQGDYVVLNYSISRLDATQMEGSPSPLRNAAVYVELQPGAPVWTMVRASFNPLTPAPGHVVIRGKTDQTIGSSSLRVTYGIESFLVPEGQGLQIERLRNASDRVTVKVRIAENGAALPENILVDGVPVFTDGGM